MAEIGKEWSGRPSNASSNERPENKKPCEIGCQDKDHGHQTKRLNAQNTHSNHSQKKAISDSYFRVGDSFFIHRQPVKLSAVG